MNCGSERLAWIVKMKDIFAHNFIAGSKVCVVLIHAVCLLLMHSACSQARLRLPEAKGNRNMKQMKQFLTQISQGTSSKKIRIRLPDISSLSIRAKLCLS